MQQRSDYKYLTEVLTDPEKVLPSLSKKEIEQVAIDALRAYQDKAFDFPTLLTITESIRYYLHPQTPLWDLLSEIRELNKYHEIIEEVISDIITELT